MHNHAAESRKTILRLSSIRSARIRISLLTTGICWIGLCLVQQGHAQNVPKTQPKVQVSKSDAFKVFDVDGDYGTLAFKGTVERTDAGDSYKYRVRLAVVFLPGELMPDGSTVTNRTKAAELKTCTIAATLFVEEGKPYKMLYREARPIAIRLTEYGEVGTLPDLEFSVPKSATQGATHVGLSVSDGRLLWPVPIELK